MKELKDMTTAEMLELREKVTDELTYRLEHHMEDYLGERDWLEETGDPFSYEEIAWRIIDGFEWDGAREYEFCTYDRDTKLKSGLYFSQKAETPEQLAEAIYEASAMAHCTGIDFARVGENVLCI